MKIARQERETMLVSEHEEFMDDVLGLTLTHLGGWPARISGPIWRCGERLKPSYLNCEPRLPITASA
jgi:hypothetical protein